MLEPFHHSSDSKRYKQSVSLWQQPWLHAIFGTPFSEWKWSPRTKLADHVACDATVGHHLTMVLLYFTIMSIHTQVLTSRMSVKT